MIAEAGAAVRANPFPGLRPFEPDEDYLFFGRELQIDALLRRLRTTRFLAILGTSGCGKSSLVRAGLIPSLHGGAMILAGSRWRVAILYPGENPIGNLAAALSAPQVLGKEGQTDGLRRAFLETTLRASRLGLVDCIRQAQIPERDNVLVLVDQFEELFRIKKGPTGEGRDEAVAFVKLLLEASRHREVPIYIALTMRSDFIGHCLEFAELPEAVNEGLYLVPRMTRDELRSAITGPVAVGGGTISSPLVSRLLNDVGDDQDQLPVLQHALLRTWNRWQEALAPGEGLELRHYETIGTMSEALSRHAEEAYGELDAEGQRIAETLFKALTEESEGKRVRRPVRLDEICTLTGAGKEKVIAVVDRFRQPGRCFLMPPPGVPLKDSSRVDISHESLMRIWDRLIRWIDEEAQSAQLYLGLARAAARHEQGRAALLQDPELQLALNWREKEQPTATWARRYDPHFDRAIQFLNASAAKRDQEIVDQEEDRRRELWKTRLLAMILGTVALVMALLGAYTYYQKDRAEKEKDRAEQALQDAEKQRQIALSEGKRANATAQRLEREKKSKEHQAFLAHEAQRKAEAQTQLANEQRRLAKAKEDEARKSEAAKEVALTQSERDKRAALVEQGRAEKAQKTAEDSEKETKRLSRLSFARALALQTLQPQQKDQWELSALLALQAYNLYRDNRKPDEPEDPDVLGALRQALARLRPEPELRGHKDAVRALALGSDGKTLVSASDDGTIRRFDLGHAETPGVVLGAYTSPVRAVALGREGLLAAGFGNGAVRVWDLDLAGSPLHERLRLHGGVVTALAFRPGRKLLASGSQDGTVKLWNLDEPQAEPVQLHGGSKRVTALAFSPRGETLAAGFAQGGALLWDLEKKELLPACPGRDVRSLAFSLDGSTLACGAGRGEISLWDAQTPDRAAEPPLTAHSSSVNALRFGPRGDVLASASSDGTVRLWNPRFSRPPAIVLTGHEAWVWAVAFTPDGSRIVSGGADRKLRVWRARPDLMAQEICDAVPRGLTEAEWREAMPKDLPYQPGQPCPGR